LVGQTRDGGFCFTPDSCKVAVFDSALKRPCLTGSGGVAVSCIASKGFSQAAVAFLKYFPNLWLSTVPGYQDVAFIEIVGVGMLMMMQTTKKKLATNALAH
jgi:hypothetical protein